jgi:hypothetical protein
MESNHYSQLRRLMFYSLNYRPNKRAQSRNSRLLPKCEYNIQAKGAYCASINGLEPFVPLYRKIEKGHITGP